MFCCGTRKERSSRMDTDGDHSKHHFHQNTTITDDLVTTYISEHPELLEKYVMENIETQQLERWIIRKMKKKSDPQNAIRKTSLSRWKFCVHADKRQMLQEITKNLQNQPAKDHVLWELANCICSAVGAEGFRLYVAEKGDPDELYLHPGVDPSEASTSPQLQRTNTGVSIPAYVARNREPVRLSRGKPDSRFPDTVMDELSSSMVHIQCHPIMQSDGKLIAVLELWRGDDAGGPFYEEDEEIACSYLMWGGIALHYAHLYFNMNKQRQLNDFLLAVVKSIFQDMISIDSLVIKIMNFAQRLVDADRASLFQVDPRTKELYSTIFDVGVEAAGTPDVLGSMISDDQDNIGMYTSKEIRFALGTGIAGHVALTGEILNIRDAYSDSRFNRAVDQFTGYTTKTILCMPIYIRGYIIGVVQMVNKHNGYFTKDDEEAFETFAIYCGLALHHAKLYDKIRKSEQKYKVALDVLSYHNTCTEGEYQAAVRTGIPKNLPGVDSYYFNPFELKDLEKARHAMYMFSDLFGLHTFDEECLLKFILTVRKNYRRVPYHNWTHGFSVANSMYCIIKHSKGAFNTNECLALYVGALCHDLDHRGKNNKFMLETESPLAAIYSTSTMEHHHFNQTVVILQQEGHNIFSKLQNDDYKQVLSLLKHCILATDLAVFFPNKAKLTEIVQIGSFSWNDAEHRMLIQAIAMTGSDLSASAKPWKIQAKTVKVIFEEFYDQGDAEKAAGRLPIPMMDRNQPDQQPSTQVGFLTGICIPCYNLLYTLIPETKALLDMCHKNLDRWRKIDEEVKTKENK
ncbi:unnamed protein product [Phaedon cochleariae]|uniref:Phosphodiesterase n=1 Tax=Phaedon cochleariae TaxID=80249 RepID=A0A9P0DXK2_PHACE|nr:unnamed protein product [Phaedon cochleariae]